MSKTAKTSLKLDKELGQHFLTNKGVIEKILRRLDLFSNREVIEVGPGGGALTDELLAAGFRVVAIEFDRRWHEELQLKFKAFIESGDFVVLLGDATQISFEEIKKHLKTDVLTLCGNLPYNRGQEIVFRFFEEATFVNAFVVMLQKEVVDKFLPKNTRKLYGPLSIKMNFLAQNLDSFFVSPGSFNPPPKVDSAVLSFQRSKNENIRDINPIKNKMGYAAFSKFLQQSFNQRRKKLSNNVDISEFPEEFKHYGAKRAEEISPDEFLEIFNSLTMKRSPLK